MFDEPQLRRRPMLGAVLASLCAASIPRAAVAAPRPPRGGRVRLRVPFAFRSFDPHQLDDLGAMLFGEALFESLYRLNEGGGVEPVLAEGLPVAQAGGLFVPLRQGLVSGRGRALGARQVVDSLERARRGAGRFVLHGIPKARATTFGVEFAMKAPERLLQALTSPLTAIVPAGFSPGVPDGTGAFLADPTPGATNAWTLRRNPRAASGIALLDSLQVYAASSLSESLRAFESGEDQIAWHGLGLHEPRPQARAFDAGTIGAVALVLGKDAGKLDVPGMAQQICDSLPPARFAHLNLGSWSQSKSFAWSAGPATLLVEADSPFLREIAETVAALLSRAGNTLSLRTVSAGELRERTRSRAFAMAITALRPLWPTPLGHYGALLAFAEPERAAANLVRPPKVQSVRSMTRSLRAGFLGELRFRGGAVGELELSRAPFDWGAAYYARKKR